MSAPAREPEAFGTGGGDVATTRERLHEMIDELPASQFDAAAHAIWALSVPEDDEPISDEEREALDGAHEAYLRGDFIPHDEAMREIRL